MSLYEIADQYPTAEGALKILATLLSEANPPAHDNNNFKVVATDTLPDGHIFIVPIFEATENTLPASSELIKCKLLWLRLQGKTGFSATAFNLVCDIVGGADYAKALLAPGQIGFTFSKLTSVFTPRA
jgi:hypothetical protein